MERNGHLAVFDTTRDSLGATRKYKVLFFDGAVDGNPDEKFRVGPDGLRECLEDGYGVDPRMVDILLCDLYRTGEASVTI